ncbi:MAG: hypothetical protein JXR76_06300 [Deltaproteobacteria bacterium]|nr:hypothetical protein [Deltaproteobacteria bacterium]
MKGKWLLILAVMAVSIAGILCFQSISTENNPEKTIINVTETRNKDAVSANETVGAVKQKKRMTAAQFRLLQQHLQRNSDENSEPIDDELREVFEASGYSRDEWDEMTRIVRESDPYFWDNATETLTEMHESEAKDPLWESEVRNRVMRSFDMKSIGDTDLDGIDCRQTLCRIDFVHKDSDALDQLRNVMRESDWMNESSNAYGNNETLEDGRIMSFVYFSKNDDGAAFLEMRKRIIEKVNPASRS